MRDHELRVFAFNREQLRLLRDALMAYRRQIKAGPHLEKIELWVEAFDPEREELT